MARLEPLRVRSMDNHAIVVCGASLRDSAATAICSGVTSPPSARRHVTGRDFEHDALAIMLAIVLACQAPALRGMMGVRAQAASAGVWRSEALRGGRGAGRGVVRPHASRKSLPRPPCLRGWVPLATFHEASADFLQEFLPKHPMPFPSRVVARRKYAIVLRVMNTKRLPACAARARIRRTTTC